eukprot:11259775-Karenia_brevis.AAC.1
MAAWSCRGFVFFFDKLMDTGHLPVCGQGGTALVVLVVLGLFEQFVQVLPVFAVFVQSVDAFGLLLRAI